MLNEMSTINHISPRTISLNAERPRGYDGAEQVKNRAAVTRTTQTPLESRALNRLGNVLDANRPPNTDVPRGFYLDISV